MLCVICVQSLRALITRTKNSSLVIKHVFVRAQVNLPKPPVEREGGNAAAPSPQVLLILLESVNSTVEPFLNTSKSRKQFDLYG